LDKDNETYNPLKKKKLLFLGSLFRYLNGLKILATSKGKKNLLHTISWAQTSSRGSWAFVIGAQTMLWDKKMTHNWSWFQV
jgi:hypothetical protein